MALAKFWAIAFRDLVRNRRRTLLTLLAVALGMAVLILMSGFLEGVTQSGLQQSIRLYTGHIQIRAASYEIEKLSLLSEDLLADSEELSAQFSSLEPIESVAPVLWTSGILSTIRESTGLQVTGLRPEDAFHAPVREGMVEGSYLTADGRGEILLGKLLADDMNITVGQRVSLALGGRDGQLEEGIFTVVGLFDTGIPNYDQGTVVMPLAQLQSFTGARDRASSIIIMLKDQEQTDRVAAILTNPTVQTLTWVDLNEVLIQTMETGGAFYYIIYTIVILVVAVLIANTLLMSVFERTREMGILASLGMKGRQIMAMFLFEAVILSLVGIFFGLILGFVAVSYLGSVGIPIGVDAATAMEGVALGTKLYADFAPREAVNLSIFMFTVVTLVSIYPAWYAARLEPVKALHAL